MSGHRPKRVLLIGILAITWFAGLNAVLWGYTLHAGYSADSDRFYIGHGVVLTWLWTRNGSSVAYEIDPLGLAVMAATAIVLAAFLLVFIRWVQRQADLKGCCERCGYRLLGVQHRCPECGSPHPDFSIASRLTDLRRIHRPLVLAVVLLLTIPGLLWALVAVSRLRTASFVKPFGSGDPYLEPFVAQVVCGLIVISTLAGLFMIWRYRTGLSNDDRNPLLGLFSDAPLRTACCAACMICLNIALAIGAILFMRDSAYYLLAFSAITLLGAVGAAGVTIYAVYAKRTSARGAA